MELDILDGLEPLVSPTAPRGDTSEPAGSTAEAQDAQGGTTTNLTEAKVINLGPEDEFDPEDNGLVTVTEFVELINKSRVAAEFQRLLDEAHLTPQDAAVASLEVQIPAASIYQMTRAARNPLPTVKTVRTLPPTEEGGEEIVRTAVYLPKVEALAAYNTRPVRGTGSVATGSKMDDEKLLRLTGKDINLIGRLEAKLKKITVELDKAHTRLASKTRSLEARGLTVDSAVKAYSEWLSAREAGTEIADDDEN